MKRERAAKAEQQAQDRAGEVRARVFERGGLGPRAPHVRARHMNPDVGLIGVLKMKAFRRPRDTDGWMAASVDMIGGVNGGGR